MAPAVAVTPTKADTAYHALRRAIVTLEIEGGEPLDEATLSERFGIGRTPLREALKRLALEQLVIAPPHRTPYVRSFSLTDLQPLFETRMLLEVPVAGIAAERATDADLLALESNLAEMVQAADHGDVYETIEIDYAFHSLLARTTHNRFLAEAICQLNRGSLRLWYLAHLKLGLHAVGSHHSELIEALRSGRREVGEEVMRGHVLRSQSRVIEAFASGVETVLSNGAVPRKGAGR